MRSKIYKKLWLVPIPALPCYQELDADLRPYKILGACNPPFAHKALEAENKIGRYDAAL